MTENIITEKTCNKCVKTLSTDKFYKCAAKQDGLMQYCKECVTQYRPPVVQPTIDKLPNEIWITCIEDSRYAVSNMGRVKRIQFGRYTKNGEYLIQPQANKHGYMEITFSPRTRVRVHRLVCRAFHGEPLPEQTDVNHKDNDRTNNRAENLEWMTRKENLHWGKQQGRDNKGERNGQAKLTEESAVQIVHLLKTTTRSHTDIGNQFDVSDSVVQRINVGKTWQYLTKDEILPLQQR